jgi:hypothetical protein
MTKHQFDQIELACNEYFELVKAGANPAKAISILSGKVGVSCKKLRWWIQNVYGEKSVIKKSKSFRKQQQQMDLEYNKYRRSVSSGYVEYIFTN